MVIEMLLNNDIQTKIVQMILHFQKEINVIMYIIEKTFKLNWPIQKGINLTQKEVTTLEKTWFSFNHFIWTKFQ